MVASEQALLTSKQLDILSINTIRTLAIDAVQKANSGHPGAPMGLAPVAYCLWQRFLRYDPADPVWPKPRPLRSFKRPTPLCCCTRRCICAKCAGLLRNMMLTAILR